MLAWQKLEICTINLHSSQNVDNFLDYFSIGDEVSGLSVSVRERDDVIQIWNTNSSLSEKSEIVNKVKELLPDVAFSAIFYKGKNFSSFNVIQCCT